MEWDILSRRMRELMLAKHQTETRLFDIETRLMRLEQRLVRLEKGRAPEAAVRPTLPGSPARI